MFDIFCYTVAIVRKNNITMQQKSTQALVVFIDSEIRISLIIYLNVMALTSSYNYDFRKI